MGSYDLNSASFVNLFLTTFSKNQTGAPVLLGRPVQSFETQYLNTNYFTFRSLFGHKFGLRNNPEDIKVFDLTFDLVEI